MSTPTLWTIARQPLGRPIRAALTLQSIPFRMPSSEEYTHFESNLKPEFRGKFPHAKIPAWEDPSKDLLLFEGAAIAKYVSKLSANSTLLGSTPEQEAQIDQWIHLTEMEIDTYTNLVRAVCTGGIAGYSKPAHTFFLERQLRALKTLNAHLASRTYFVGERLTLADLFVAALIQKAVGVSMSKEVRAQVPHVVRHLETIVNHPQLKEIYGEIDYTDKGLQFVPPKKDKDEKKKEAKPKAEAKPKEEKKPKKKEVEVEEDDGDEPLVPEEPKKKNPLDDLPKSTFNLEDWKRAYSNMETRGDGGALEWFYKNYDPAGFSIHRVAFKYPAELTQTFMSSNQITGFFNRLEASRKYLFASVGVLGQTNDSVIEGAMVCRGDKIEPVVEVAPDWESYAFSPLDLSKPEDKEFFEGAMAWDLEVAGKKWVDGKNFK
ncbi:elongation factor 1-gamma [Hymenopellis radicata]|nr:elongation factor 1-gamma [Hymenopellis radicata]